MENSDHQLKYIFVRRTLKRKTNQIIYHVKKCVMSSRTFLSCLQINFPWVFFGNLALWERLKPNQYTLLALPCILQKKVNLYKFNCESFELRTIILAANSLWTLTHLIIYTLTANRWIALDFITEMPFSWNSNQLSWFSFKNVVLLNILLSHYPKYLGLTTKKDNTFTTQGPNIPDSVKGGYKIIQSWNYIQKIH